MFNPEEPLWLPKGSVRAIIALFVVALGTAYLVWTGGDVLPLVTLVLGFYFGTRQAQEPTA